MNTEFIQEAKKEKKKNEVMFREWYEQTIDGTKKTDQLKEKKNIKIEKKSNVENSSVVIWAIATC